MKPKNFIANHQLRSELNC